MEDETMIRVHDIRERIDRSEYDVDPRQIAAAILARLVGEPPAGDPSPQCS